MDDIKMELHIITPMGEKEVIPLEACIFGGVMGDGSEASIGSYLGAMGFEKSLVSMVHVTRAFLKMMEENVHFMVERKLIPPTSDRAKMLKIAGDLAIMCVEQALKVELIDDPKENLDLKTHSNVMKVRWDKEKGEKK